VVAGSFSLAQLIRYSALGMPVVSYISPLDQPTGQRRLLEDLRSCLRDARYRLFIFAAAFAASGPLHRLRADLESWRMRGGRTLAIFGIDHQGTSKQALELALQLSDVFMSLNTLVYYFIQNAIFLEVKHFRESFWIEQFHHGRNGDKLRNLP
jgi:hypothetical protein